jgi:hypothetical protein
VGTSFDHQRGCRAPLATAERAPVAAGLVSRRRPAPDRPPVHNWGGAGAKTHSWGRLCTHRPRTATSGPAHTSPLASTAPQKKGSKRPAPGVRRPHTMNTCRSSGACDPTLSTLPTHDSQSG